MGMLIGLLFLAFMVSLLVAILRFTIVSERRMRGAEGRLRSSQCNRSRWHRGFPPPADLVAFYERAPFLDRKEFQLVDPAQEAGRAWDIGEFIPLTARDAREAMAISSVKQPFRSPGTWTRACTS